MDLGERRELWNGFGDGLAAAFELAVTPAIFGGLGWFVDGRLGIRPVLTIVLSILACVAMGLRMYYRYEADMTAREADTPWGRARAAGRSSHAPKVAS